MRVELRWEAELLVRCRTVAVSWKKGIKAPHALLAVSGLIDGSVVGRKEPVSELQLISPVPETLLPLLTTAREAKHCPKLWVQVGSRFCCIVLIPAHESQNRHSRYTAGVVSAFPRQNCLRSQDAP